MSTEASISVQIQFIFYRGEPIARINDDILSTESKVGKVVFVDKEFIHLFNDGMSYEVTGLLEVKNKVAIIKNCEVKTLSKITTNEEIIRMYQTSDKGFAYVTGYNMVEKKNFTVTVDTLEDARTILTYLKTTYKNIVSMGYGSIKSIGAEPNQMEFKRPTYLIQRGEFTTGFIKDIEKLKDIVDLDYMGSSEFEFGAIGKSLTRMVEFNSDFNNFQIEIKDQWFGVYTRKNSVKSVISWLELAAENNHPHTKEYVGFNFQFNRSDFNSRLEVDFWWDIENDFMVYPLKHEWKIRKYFEYQTKDQL